jgi:hypothetical protein
MSIDQAIAALREMNEEVPQPMRLPTDQEVDAAQKELGVTFHPDYRKYLLQASDVVFGTKEPATITDAESHTYLPTVAEDAWEMGVPKKLLPICEDNGDYYCMNQKGQVLYVSADGETMEKWSDLAAWIEEVWIGEDEEA